MYLLQDELELRGLIFKNNSLVWKDALEKDPEITHKKKDILTGNSPLYVIPYIR